MEPSKVKFFYEVVCSCNDVNCRCVFRDRSEAVDFINHYIANFYVTDLVMSQIGCEEDLLNDYL